MNWSIINETISFHFLAVILLAWAVAYIGFTIFDDQCIRFCANGGYTRIALLTAIAITPWVVCLILDWKTTLIGFVLVRTIEILISKFFRKRFLKIIALIDHHFLYKF